MNLDFTKMRTFARKNINKSWYKEFCNIWDEEDVNTVQKFLRSKPKVFEQLKAIATNYYEGKTGNPLNRHELYALRHPNLMNKCSCGTFLPYRSNTNTWALGCSQSCSAKACVPQKKSTCIQKYGEDNPSKVEKFKRKRTKTIQSRFGVDNAFQSKKIMRKAKATLQKKYGVDNPSQSEEIQKRKEATSLENFGTSHWTKSESMKHKLTPFNEHTMSKAKDTCIKKYGVDNPFKSSEIQDQIKATHKRKYGRNPGGIPNGFKRKEVADKSGKLHIVQGYETLAIEYFDSQKSIIRIETNSRLVPRFRYKHNDKLLNYYPDMIVFSRTTAHVIEVKSSWTLKVNLEVNLKKFSTASKACQRKGMNFWLLYFKDNGDLIRVKNPTTLRQLQKAGIPV